MANKNLTLALKIKADLKQAITELDQMGLSLDDTRRSADKLNQTNNATAFGFKSIAASVKAATLTVAAGFSLNEIIRSADAWTAYQNRLRLVTSTQIGLQISSQDVYKIARETSQQLDSTAAVYQRFAQNADRLNITQKETAQLTDTVSKAIAISGGSAASSEAALVQFGQALASGVLRGEEFNSVSEQAYGLLDAIADGLDVDIGKLREMANAGELTADKLVQALQKSKDAVDAQFETRVKTVAQGATELNTAFTRLVGTLSTTNGMSATLAASLTGVADVIDSMADNTEILGAVIDAALVLTAGRALIAVTGLRVAKIKAVLATRAEIAAELTAAKAHAASTARQLASARAGGVATTVVAAHTAALQRLAVAQSAASLTAGGILGILGGPVGMIALTAVAATGLYAFRDSTNDVKSSLSDLSEPLEKVVEGLRQLTELERQQELTRLSQQIDNLVSDSIDQAGRLKSALRSVLDQAPGGVNSNSLVPGLDNALNSSGDVAKLLGTIRNASKDLEAGVKVDFDSIYHSIENASGISDEARQQMLDLLEVILKKSKKVKNLKQRYEELTSALGETEAAADKTGDALTKNSPEAEKAAKTYLESLQKQFRQLSDLSPVEQARSYLLRNQINEHSELGQKILQQAEANQKLDESNRAAAESERQATAAVKEAQRQIDARLRDQQKYVEQLEYSVEVQGLSTDKVREYELAEKNLTGTLLQRAQAANKAIEAQEQLNKAMEDAKQLDDIQIQLLEDSGQGFEAQSLKLEQRYGELLQRLRDRGDEAGTSLVDKLINLDLAKSRLNELQKGIDKAIRYKGYAEESIQIKNDSLALTDFEAREALLKVHKETYNILDQQRPLLEQMAQLSGQVGSDAKEALIQINLEMERLQSTTTLLEETLSDSLQNGISDAIQGLVNGTLSLRDAVGTLVSSIADSMTKLLADNLAQLATREIINLFKQSATAGTAAAAQTATAQVAAINTVTAAQTTSDMTRATSSVASAQVAATGQTAAAAQTTAAWTPAATAASIGSFGSAAAIGIAAVLAALALAQGAFKDGGHVTGPGTETSDSIPARLSHNEFVTRAAVVKQPGALGFLYDFNSRGMEALDDWNARVGHATGGLAGVPAPAMPAPGNLSETALAQPAAAAGQNTTELTINNIFDSDEAAQSILSTSTARRSINNHIRANKRQIKALLEV